VAGKRRPVDPGIAERLFSDRLKRLRGEIPPSTNKALQALVGSESAPAPQGSDSADAVDESPRPRRSRKAGSRLSVFRGVTVSLSAQDLKDADFIAASWSGSSARRISRSKVIRAAIRDLRESLERGSKSG
jgi:hypothetical protein